MNPACHNCRAELSKEDLKTQLWLCPSCGAHLPMPARARLELLADPGSMGERISEAVGGDPLHFVDTRPYPERLAEARQLTGEGEAFISLRCTVGGIPTVLGAMDFAFMGGSMSSAVGERVVRSFECAADEGRAVVICTASGGARMQEGTLSLFQMTRTAVAVSHFKKAQKPYISLLTDPTMGGVAASFGTLADVLLAEPGARIGFAGPRVVKELLGESLPEGYQTAEFQLAHGMLDRIVPRKELRKELVSLLRLLSGLPSGQGEKGALEVSGE